MIKLQFAGKFYPDNFNDLAKDLEKAFLDERGPGETPGERGKSKVKGILVPHSGYRFCGTCSAWAYKEIAEAKENPTYLLLAPDNTGKVEQITTSKEVWESIMGSIIANEDFVNELIKLGIKEDKIVNYAIELQLPFLEYANKDRLKDLQIVPLVVPKIENIKELAEKIINIDKNICVIIASNFTMFGESYNYVPFKYNILKSVKEFDGGAIEFVKILDSEGFLKYCKKSNSNISGQYAIALGLEIMKLLGSEKSELLSYYNTGDVTGDYNNFVSYASLIFI